MLRLAPALILLATGAASRSFAVPLTVRVFNAAGEIVRSFPPEDKPLAVTTLTLSYTASGGCTSWTGDTGRPFSPDGDCINDLLQIGFPELTDTTTGHPHDHHWWNGATDLGEWAPNGAYLVSAETTHTLTGAPIVTTVPVTLSAVRGTVDARIYGASGLLVKTLAGITLPGIANVWVDPNPYAPEVTGTNLVSFRLRDAGGAQIGVLTWNGRNESGRIVDNGAYTLVLRFTGPGGDVTTVSASFTVLHDDLRLIEDLRPVPNPVKADGGGIWLSYRPVAAGILTSIRLTVWTISGDRLLSRDLSAQPTPSDPLDANDDGKASVFWNLKTGADRDVGAGLYLAGLEITGGGGQTQRAFVKIGVR